MTEDKITIDLTKTHIYLLKEMCNRDIESGMVVPQHQWQQAQELTRVGLAGWNKSRDDPYVRIRITEKGLEVWETIQKNR